MSKRSSVPDYQDPGVGERLRRLARETQAMPVLDDRHPDRILGYDDNGLPSSRVSASPVDRDQPFRRSR